MSRQLAISSLFSVLAMALFVITDAAAAPAAQPRPAAHAR